MRKRRKGRIRIGRRFNFYNWKNFHTERLLVTSQIQCLFFLIFLRIQIDMFGQFSKCSSHLLERAKLLRVFLYDNGRNGFLMIRPTLECPNFYYLRTLIYMFGQWSKYSIHLLEKPYYNGVFACNYRNWFLMFKTFY